MRKKKAAAKAKPQLDRCESCGEKAGKAMHSCPFRVEIHDDEKTLCNCCDNCTHECAMDV